MNAYAAATTSNNGASAVAAVAGKYLTFQLAGEVYGLGILQIQEIIGVMNVTRVPRMPPFVRGVMNLRGKVIPVVDLRLKFGMPPKEDTPRTCIVVVQVKGMAGLLTMGIVVDEVSEVLNISAQQIDEAPAFGASVDTTFILGMGKIGQRVVILLEIQTVLSAEETAQVEQVAPAA